MKRFFMFFIIGVTFFCVCKRETDREIEPNNSFKEATKIIPDKKYAGNLSTKEDTDYFIIETDKTVTASIALTAVKGVNHALNIYREIDEKPFLVKNVDDSRKSSQEEIPNIGMKPGKYYIQVLFGDMDDNKGNDLDPYYITVKFKDYQDEEFEPNDFSEQATPVEEGKEYKGFFSPGFNKLNRKEQSKLCEYDFYSLEISADKPVLFDATLSAVSRVNSVLALLDADGNVLIFSDNGAEGSGEMIRGWGIQKSGRYYLRVNSKNFEKNSEQNYVISYKTAQFDSGLELEPNDNIQNVNLMKSGDISGKIYPENDRDFFQYSATGKKMFNVKAVPPSNLDLRLKIYDDKHDMVFDINDSPVGIQEILPGYIYDKTFFIEVSGGSTSEMNMTYSLRIDESDVQDSFEVEPNNNKESANKFTGKNVKGYNSFKGDIDYYLLDLNKKSTVNILYTGSSGAGAEVSFTDNIGYTVKTISVKPGEKVEIKELVDMKAYLIIKTLTAGSLDPYMIEVQ